MLAVVSKVPKSASTAWNRLRGGYTYYEFAESTERGFLLTGMSLGALYPMMKSTRREDFDECVLSTAFGMCVGIGGGWLACWTHPIWMTSLAIGGPMWLMQRVRFPDPDAKKEAELYEKLRVVFKAQEEVARREGAAADEARAAAIKTTLQVAPVLAAPAIASIAAGAKQPEMR